MIHDTTHDHHFHFGFRPVQLHTNSTTVLLGISHALSVQPLLLTTVTVTLFDRALKREAAMKVHPVLKTSLLIQQVLQSCASRDVARGRCTAAQEKWQLSSSLP